MITTVVQRFTARRERYRPAGERIRPSDYEVVEEASEAEIKAWVEREHYEGSFPAARFRFSLRARATGQIKGGAIFAVPTHPAIVTNFLPGHVDESVVLSRFVLAGEVPGNGETWFLAPCLRILRRHGILGVVSFCDPVPRLVEDAIVTPGHIGGIYQGSNALYLGRTDRRTTRLFADGTTWDRRTEQKIFSDEKGWVGAAEQLVARGATPPPATRAARRRWVIQWRARLTTTCRGDKLRYIFPIANGVESHVRRVGQVRRYPKAERDERGLLVRIIEFE